MTRLGVTKIGDKAYLIRFFGSFSNNIKIDALEGNTSEASRALFFLVLNYTSFILNLLNEFKVLVGCSPTASYFLLSA